MTNEDRPGRNVFRYNVFVPIPRPAYNAIRAFCEVVGADVQIVLINAVRDHLDGYELNAKDRKRYLDRLDKLEKEDRQ